jgi:hypothetical protein
LVEASLHHEAKANANSLRSFFVMLKHRPRSAGSDIHSMQLGPVVRDSPTLQRLQVLSRIKGERWQVTRIWWRVVGEAQRKSLTKNQSD